MLGKLYVSSCRHLPGGPENLPHLMHLVPQVVTDVLRVVRSSTSNTSTTFTDYEAARRACQTDGYEASDVVKLVAAKTHTWRDSLASSPALGADANQARLLLGLEGAQQNGKLSVLDLGGACGATYFYAQRYFGDRVTLEWDVIETSAMADAGREQFQSANLRFYDSIEQACAKRIPDLVLASSSLQYMPDTLGTLRKVVKLGARHLLIVRQGVYPGAETVTIVQRSRLGANGPGPVPKGFKDGYSEYPVTYVSQATFEAAIREEYDIQLIFDELPQIVRVRGMAIPSRGYVCKRKVPATGSDPVSE